MFRPSLFKAYLLVGIAVSFTAPAWGQSASSGSFGARNLGGSFSQPTSSFNGSAAARGAGAGAATTGVGGSAAGATTRGDASVGQVTGAERFLRSNRQAGQFVGSDSADAQNFFSQMANQSLNNNQQQRRNNNANNPNNGQNSQSRQNVSVARVQATIGFNYAPPTDSNVAATLQQRLEKSPRIARHGPLTVQLEGRTAVLSGIVATAHDRELAAQVARLESGVAAVRNELQVAPVLPPAPQLPPGP